jgi:rhodanese-related sulfurtransferase
VKFLAPSYRHLFIEMLCLLLAATLLGIAWNHRLLYGVWTGQLVSTAAGPDHRSGQENMPLPVGLMQVKELYDRHEAVLVDARDGAAFAAGHITGATSLPVGEAEAERIRFMERVSFSTLIVVYCNGYDCHDSRELAERLVKWGYRTVYVFEGGYPEWRAAGNPISGDAP